MGSNPKTWFEGGALRFFSRPKQRVVRFVFRFVCGCFLFFLPRVFVGLVMVIINIVDSTSRCSI